MCCDISNSYIAIRSVLSIGIDDLGSGFAEAVDRRVTKPQGSDNAEAIVIPIIV
jgi:hypothetical protein